MKYLKLVDSYLVFRKVYRKMQTNKQLTTEEISASMEQMQATINSNTENAEITGNSTKESANEMKESNEIFIETVQAVAEIS